LSRPKPFRGVKGTGKEQEEVEKRMHNDAPFRDFEMTERSGSLLNDIGEQRAEGTKLYEQMCRLDYGM
jgi:hypothetical protein